MPYEVVYSNDVLWVGCLKLVAQMVKIWLLMMFQSFFLRVCANKYYIAKIADEALNPEKMKLWTKIELLISNQLHSCLQLAGAAVEIGSGGAY